MTHARMANVRCGMLYSPMVKARPMLNDLSSSLPANPPSRAVADAHHFPLLLHWTSHIRLPIWSFLLLLLLLLLLASGCGYTQRELFPTEHRTVAVPIFENRTHYRHVAMDLSEALIKEIERRTPYKVVAPATADTILQGAVVQVDQTQLSRRREGGVPEELEVRVVVNFEWKDLQSGQVLRSRSGFDEVGRYVVSRPVGEPFENAQHTAVQRLARDIVSVMRASE